MEHSPLIPQNFSERKMVMKSVKIFPTEYEFTTKKGLVLLKKKSSAVLKEKPGTPVKASFDKRGVRYFEVVKKK